MEYNEEDSLTNKEKQGLELKQFHLTLNRLREKLSLKDMEKITGIKASNLSAYGTGKKNPSPGTIKKFNAKLKSHIDKLPKLSKTTKNDGHATQVEEERLAYSRRTNRPPDHTGELVDLLSTNYDRMWEDNERRSNAFDKIADSNYKMADTTNKLADTASQLANTTNQLATTTAQLSTANAQLAAINVQLYEKLFPNSGDIPAPVTPGP